MHVKITNMILLVTCGGKGRHRGSGIEERTGGGWKIHNKGFNLLFDLADSNFLLRHCCAPSMESCLWGGCVPEGILCALSKTQGQSERGRSSFSRKAVTARASDFTISTRVCHASTPTDLETVCSQQQSHRAQRLQKPHNSNNGEPPQAAGRTARRHPHESTCARLASPCRGCSALRAPTGRSGRSSTPARCRPPPPAPIWCSSGSPPSVAGCSGPGSEEAEADEIWGDATCIEYTVVVLVVLPRTARFEKGGQGGMQTSLEDDHRQHQHHHNNDQQQHGGIKHCHRPPPTLPPC